MIKSGNEAILSSENEQQTSQANHGWVLAGGIKQESETVVINMEKL